MMLVGQEERSLWSATAARAYENTVMTSESIRGMTIEQIAQKKATIAAAEADAIVLEFRARNGSRP